MICASFRKKNEVDRFVVYILDQYECDESRIAEFLTEIRSELKLKDEKMFTTSVIRCPNQTVMSCQFLDDVKACG